VPVTSHVGQPRPEQLRAIREQLADTILPLGIEDLSLEERTVHWQVCATTRSGSGRSSIRPSAFLCTTPLMLEAVQAATQRAIQTALDLNGAHDG
jgi:hypothetical protein